MRILLDTHLALWAIADDPRLNVKARALITNADNEILVSAASIWEVAIKHSLGRTHMPISGKRALTWFNQAGYLLLPVTAEHAAMVEELPPIHADPFDRIIVAQALAEPLRVLTHDRLMAKYSDTIILV